MNSFSLMILAAVFSQLLFFAYGRESSDERLEIYGGQNALRGDFPYMVLLQINKNWLTNKYERCGGVIVSKRAILTAASCFDNWDNKTIVIQAGFITMGARFKSTRHSKDVVLHEHYNKTTKSNDIAIIRLKVIYIFSNIHKIQPANLTTSGQEVDGSCMVAGWGYNSGDCKTRKYYDTLQKLSIGIISDDDCDYYYYNNGTIKNTMICAMNGKGYNGPCIGDAGGPFVCDGFLAGIYSWSEGCGTVYSPSVYTEISYFSDWIAAKITP